MTLTEVLKDYRNGKTIKRELWPKDKKMNFKNGESVALQIEDTYATDWIVAEDQPQITTGTKTITLDYSRELANKLEGNNAKQLKDTILAFSELVSNLKSNEHIGRIEIKINTIKGGK